MRNFNEAANSSEARVLNGKDIGGVTRRCEIVEPREYQVADGHRFVRVTFLDTNEQEWAWEDSLEPVS